MECLEVTSMIAGDKVDVLKGDASLVRRKMEKAQDTAERREQRKWRC